MRKTIFVLGLGLWGLAFVLGACGTDKDKKDATTDTSHEVTPDLRVDDVVQPDVTPDTADVRPDPTPDVTPDVAPDGGCAPKHGGICNAVTNCGCSPPDSCGVFVDQTSCQLVEDCGTAGTIAVGGDCASQPNGCAIGSTCLTAGGESKCYRWCENESDCDSGRSCSIGPITVRLPSPCSGTATINYKACDLGCPADKACDPFTGTGCATPNNACLIDYECKVLFCMEPGTHAAGEDCSDHAGCVLGTECFSIDSGATYKCYPFCDSGHACATGTCSPLGYAPNASLGICT